jgi:hypothetical protein
MILVLDYEIKNEKNFHLTLSGRLPRHAIWGLKSAILWSLAQYAYAQWAGLYENLGRYVYVNRGFDFTPTQVE